MFYYPEAFYGLIPLALLILWYFFYVLPKEKTAENLKSLKAEQFELKREDQHIEAEKKEYAMSYFQVELGTTFKSKNYAYDEIVRLVNLQAVNIAKLCVQQDKVNRGIFSTSQDSYLDEELKSCKRNWSSSKNAVLKIEPNLDDRMPHFSEFEPLKSYNAEHLLKKKAKSK